MSNHTCSDSGVTFETKDIEEEGYKRGYVQGHNTGFSKGLEFAYNNVKCTFDHLSVELGRAREKVRNEN